MQPLLLSIFVLGPLLSLDIPQLGSYHLQRHPDRQTTNSNLPPATDVGVVTNVVHNHSCFAVKILLLLDFHINISILLRFVVT